MCIRDRYLTVQVRSDCYDGLACVLRCIADMISEENRPVDDQSPARSGSLTFVDGDSCSWNTITSLE